MNAAETIAVEAKPCECDEPDGPCEGCDDEHGHTCIECGHEFCSACWLTERHAEQPCAQAREYLNKMARGVPWYSDCPDCPDYMGRCPTCGRAKPDDDDEARS